MGCAGSKGEGATGAGNVPKAQGQSGSAAEKAKDEAAAEIQKAAKVFKEKKDAELAEKAKDTAAAEIQGSAALYLAKKREEREKAEAAKGGGNIIDAVVGFFSGRPAPAPPAPPPAAAPPAAAAAPAAA